MTISKATGPLFLQIQPQLVCEGCASAPCVFGYARQWAGTLLQYATTKEF